jgi:hypothetical protein
MSQRRRTPPRKAHGVTARDGANRRGGKKNQPPTPEQHVSPLRQPLLIQETPNQPPRLARRLSPLARKNLTIGALVSCEARPLVDRCTRANAHQQTTTNSSWSSETRKTLQVRELPRPCVPAVLCSVSRLAELRRVALVPFFCLSFFSKLAALSWAVGCVSSVATNRGKHRGCHFLRGRENAAAGSVFLLPRAGRQAS